MNVRKKINTQILVEDFQSSFNQLHKILKNNGVPHDELVANEIANIYKEVDSKLSSENKVASSDSNMSAMAMFYMYFYLGLDDSRQFRYEMPSFQNRSDITFQTKNENALQKLKSLYEDYCSNKAIFNKVSFSKIFVDISNDIKSHKAFSNHDLKFRLIRQHINVAIQRIIFFKKDDIEDSFDDDDDETNLISLINPSTIVEDENTVYSDDKIIIYLADSKEKCQFYGNNSDLCISTTNEARNYYWSYRIRPLSTYFVYWKDGSNRILVDATDVQDEYSFNPISSNNDYYIRKQDLIEKYPDLQKPIEQGIVKLTPLSEKEQRVKYIRENIGDLTDPQLESKEDYYIYIDTKHGNIQTTEWRMIDQNVAKILFRRFVMLGRSSKMEDVDLYLKNIDKQRYLKVVLPRHPASALQFIKDNRLMSVEKLTTEYPEIFHSVMNDSETVLEVCKSLRMLKDVNRALVTAKALQDDDYMSSIIYHYFTGDGEWTELPQDIINSILEKFMDKPIKNFEWIRSFNNIKDVISGSHVKYPSDEELINNIPKSLMEEFNTTVKQVLHRYYNSSTVDHNEEYLMKMVMDDVNSLPDEYIVDYLERIVKNNYFPYSLLSFMKTLVNARHIPIPKILDVVNSDARDARNLFIGVDLGVIYASIVSNYDDSTPIFEYIKKYEPSKLADVLYRIFERSDEDKSRELMYKFPASIFTNVKNAYGIESRQVLSSMINVMGATDESTINKLCKNNPDLVKDMVLLAMRSPDDYLDFLTSIPREFISDELIMHSLEYGTSPAILLKLYFSNYGKPITMHNLPSNILDNFLESTSPYYNRYVGDLIMWLLSQNIKYSEIYNKLSSHINTNALFHLFRQLMGGGKFDEIIDIINFYPDKESMMKYIIGNDQYYLSFADNDFWNFIKTLDISKYDWYNRIMDSYYTPEHVKSYFRNLTTSDEENTTQQINIPETFEKLYSHLINTPYLLEERAFVKPINSKIFDNIVDDMVNIEDTNFSGGFASGSDALFDDFNLRGFIGLGLFDEHDNRLKGYIYGYRMGEDGEYYKIDYLDLSSVKFHDPNFKNLIGKVGLKNVITPEKTLYVSNFAVLQGYRARHGVVELLPKFINLARQNGYEYIVFDGLPDTAKLFLRPQQSNTSGEVKTGRLASAGLSLLASYSSGYSVMAIMKI